MALIMASISAATLLTALVAMTIPAYADPNNPTADENVHEHTPEHLGGKQDRAYHEGTCQGGSDSPACDFDIITDPGNSDDHRQDDKND